jgi:hypothetical protein
VPNKKALPQEDCGGGDIAKQGHQLDRIVKDWISIDKID